MWTNKPLRAVLAAACLLVSGLAAAAAAAGDLGLQHEGRLRVAVYEDFPPYSDKGKGIDVAIGRELAKRLGLDAEVVAYPADEDMSDDLRNMVWKGHYLGTAPGDVMLHVPVDSYLAKQNEQVHIFGPYQLETLAVVRDPGRVPPVAGSAARALEVFTREKIGVETGSLADSFLLTVLNGRLRENVTHYNTVAAAVAGLRAGEVAAVMAPRGEIEGAMPDHGRFELSGVTMPELRIQGWPLGMAVKAGNHELQAALAAAMTQIEQDGTLDKIFAQYGVTRHAP